MVESWKSDPLLSVHRLPTIHFLVQNCGANINIQVCLHNCLSGFCVLHISVGSVLPIL